MAAPKAEYAGEALLFFWPSAADWSLCLPAAVLFCFVAPAAPALCCEAADVAWARTGAYVVDTALMSGPGRPDATPPAMYSSKLG
jgi:hypothetical protein